MEFVRTVLAGKDDGVWIAALAERCVVVRGTAFKRLAESVGISRTGRSVLMLAVARFVEGCCRKVCGRFT